MAQSVAVVRGTLSATLSGTTDFTKSGFGTPTAAIVIIGQANTSANPAVDAMLGIGFWDGTDQRAVAVSALDAQATSSTFRTSNDSYAAIASSTTASSYTISSITDGVRLTLSVDNTGLERYATVILFAGVSASAFSFTPNSTQNSTATKSGLSFAPSLAFFASIGSAFADDAAGNAILSFGMASSAPMNRLLGFGSVTSSADEVANILFSESRCVGQIFNNATSWTGEVTSWTSDGFVMTTRDGASGGDVCFALALGGADLSFDAGTLTTPTSTGNSSVSTSIAPDAVLLALSTATGTTIESGSGANGLMVGLADDNGQYAHNMSVEDGAATTNANSAASASALVNLDSSSGGSRTDIIDGTVTLNGSDFTINYSATDGTARKGWWVAFGAAGGGTASADASSTAGATATATGASIASAAANSAGSATATAAGAAIASGDLNAAGTATGTLEGSEVVVGVESGAASSEGTATATAASASIASAAASAAGAATATAEGASTAEGAFSSSGSATAIAVGSDTDAVVTPTRYDGWLPREVIRMQRKRREEEALIALVMAMDEDMRRAA